jgi:hypothetical protein
MPTSKHTFQSISLSHLIDTDSIRITKIATECSHADGICSLPDRNADLIRPATRRVNVWAAIKATTITAHVLFFGLEIFYLPRVTISSVLLLLLSLPMLPEAATPFIISKKAGGQMSLF